VDTPANQAFEAANTRRFGIPPSQISFESYETAKVLIDAIARSGTGTPAAIRDALTTTKLPSILGTTISFDDHNLAHNNAVVMIIKDGKVVLLDFSKT
jgi:branched-chain amino acid transport system substrate-binding protein